MEIYASLVSHKHDDRHHGGKQMHDRKTKRAFNMIEDIAGEFTKMGATTVAASAVAAVALAAALF